MESKVLKVEDKTLKGKLPVGLAVMGDNVSDRISFTMSKYIDGVDVSKKSIYVCYKNANGESYLCNCRNITVSGDELSFDWYITKEATAFSGDVYFHLEISDGNYIWRSYDSSFSVDDCVITDIADTIEYDPNWLDVINETITKGKTDMSAIEARAKSYSEAAGTSATNAANSASSAATSASNAQSYLTQAKSYVDTHTAIIILTTTLTNTAAYPFNGSKKTIAFANADVRSDTNYIITPEVTSHSGGDVGNIIISDKMTNGFKVEHTGSATNVALTLYVQGGV